MPNNEDLEGRPIWKATVRRKSDLKVRSKVIINYLSIREMEPPTKKLRSETEQGNWPC